MTSKPFLYVLVFVVGAASLGAEIAVARLMAPFFGASTIVWANTIGVVLVALAVGYWLGGRLGDRHPASRGLCLLVMAAAVLLALVPFVARPFFDVSVDALDSLSAGAFAGSLMGVLVLIAVPVILLGACSPYAIRLTLPDIEHSGRIAGRLYAVSTAGSLVGTMLAALVLIPFTGTQRTFLVFAIALAVVAAAGLGWRFAPLPAVLAAAIAIPVGTIKGTDDGRVLYEGETTLQYARVVEEPDGARVLELNEGQAIHSLYRPGSYLTGGYWDGMVTLPFATMPQQPRRVAILGNGAGTTSRAYGRFFHRARIDAVEIDPELTELGHRYFHLRSGPNLTVHDEDARPWLRQSSGRYDVIVVDSYRQPYIPFYLTTREFFALAGDRLAPGGVVVVNVGHPSGSDELETVIGRTMAEAFTTVFRDPFDETNTLLLGSEAPATETRLRSAAAGLPRPLAPIARSQAARIGPRLPGGTVYTDDLAPVEWLVDRSILGYAAGE
ncbi:MAG TPA: fused MFS/spermidine synthase [Solirubrobacterales bacterium]|jgi:spermidine synthase|nr:fused MFS/spermidine synthase [Solirubrobacterales bacterium]